MSDVSVPGGGAGATGVTRGVRPGGRLPGTPRTRSGSSSWISAIPGARGLRLVERHARFYRKLWLVVASGAAEPLFYLLSVGVGIGGLVGTVAGPDGQQVPYREFVAP